MTENCYIITDISCRGRPTLPKKAANSFSMNVGAIVRRFCLITQKWHEIPETTKQHCLEEVWRRYKIKQEHFERVRAAALAIMRTTHGNWRRTARTKWLDKDYEQVKEKWPSIKRPQWEEFKMKANDPEFLVDCEKFKQLRAKKTHNHHLGSRGREGKEPVWAKQDAQMEKDGVVPPLLEIVQHDRTRDYVRMNVGADEWAGTKPLRDDMRTLAVRVSSVFLIVLTNS